MKRLLFILFVGIAAFGIRGEVTLEQCLDSARVNYPLIRKFNLLKNSELLDIFEINRGWYPRIGIYAQGTVQNVVPTFPTPLSRMMEQMGGDIRGLGRLQYKLGIDLQQTIWDGGAAKVGREIARSRTKVEEAALEVDMYAIRQRVEGLYFGILLMEAQIAQSESALKVYESNLQRLRAMVENGVAMQADADMVEAQQLGIKQQLAQARSAVKGYREMLSIFTGMDLGASTLRMPSAEIPADLTPNRPELGLFGSRMELNAQQKEQTTVAVMPKFGLFAQSYYGYPGIDYFKAMMGRDPSFNLLAGLKVSWNIDSFYNKKAAEKKLDIANSEIEAERSTFLFNTRMQTESQMEQIRGLEAVMQDDQRIVDLRQNVRHAAESQLNNGIIDATALVMKINDETQARLASAYHTIQYTQAIHNLKTTLNR